MPTKRYTKRTTRTKAELKHLCDMPDNGAAIMQEISKTILPLCPGCRMEMLAFVCATAVKQIATSQQKAYFKELMRATYYAIETIVEVNDEGETVH